MLPPLPVGEGWLALGAWPIRLLSTTRIWLISHVSTSYYRPLFTVRGIQILGFFLGGLARCDLGIRCRIPALSACKTWIRYPLPDIHHAYSNYQSLDGEDGEPHISHPPLHRRWMKREEGLFQISFHVASNLCCGSWRVGLTQSEKIGIYSGNRWIWRRVRPCAIMV